MPTVKPSDKSGHEGEWWRKDKTQHQGELQVDPETSAHNSRDAGKNKYDSEQEPTKHPT